MAVGRALVLWCVPPKMDTSAVLAVGGAIAARADEAGGGGNAEAPRTAENNNEDEAAGVRILGVMVKFAPGVVAKIREGSTRKRGMRGEREKG